MSAGVPDRTGRARRAVRGAHPVRAPRLVRGPRAVRGPRPDAVPALIASACTLVGLLDIAAGVFPRFRHSRMHTVAEVLPGALGPFAAALSLSTGVLLLLLAHGLRRRKRRAWRAAVVLLPAGAVAQFAYRHSLIGVAISLALLAPLLRHRSEFEALPDPRSRWRALANFVLMGAGSLVLGLVIVSVHANRMIGSPSLADRITHVLYGLFGFEGPLDYTGPTSWTVAVSLGALGLLTAITTIYLAFRPEHPAARLTEDDEARLRALLDKHGGRDSLGHFALRRDKGVVFSPSGKAAVTYRVVSGVMLASGDPVGDVEAWPGAIERFMDEAKAHSWTPAVMGCSETGGEVWTRETGLDALELGDEAVVDVADFSLAGRAMRNVRQMVKRIERAGYETRVRRVRDLSEGELDRIRRATEDWRGTDTERGFSMALGRIGDPADGDCLIATAHKADVPGIGAEPAHYAEPGPYGDLKAVLHFVPWGTDGVSLDLMRRDRSADPGMNELLIVAALQAAPRLGIERVSLNFAMFRAALARGEKIGAGPVLRVWRGLLVFLSRWFQIESLYKFNAKFRPRWEPRFVVYGSSRDLPRIGLAAMQAEGFVSLALPRLLRRRRTAPRPCAHAVAERGVRAA
ncbi:phosphatidylglycerol lysyltransferase domain-containing protein [Streptomyces sp. NBC_00620]|uniref:phosphatidylglycerol lysyltransferase domain-containing protein n=1 Tax=Streptomyces sp. NBC_00620 TaxID=2903666 RepID=UPI00225ADD3E|nr:phosphatidylglycerol lysyltransferase domain-containing protein [Streptomyces sp. NBC_00620]MCX4972520.1 phosphatidylglycerol lysyltransferase domain-containing protein [Streptomyces sp. NBC_00620]